MTKINTTLNEIKTSVPVPGGKKKEKKSQMFGIIPQASLWLWGPEVVLTLWGAWQDELHCGTAEQEEESAGWVTVHIIPSQMRL